MSARVAPPARRRMTAKTQRLVLVIVALGLVIGAALLALSALKNQASFFYSPSDVQRDGLPLGRAVRLGGMVEARSLSRAPDGVTIRFVVIDPRTTPVASTPVTFAGIVPSLFREGSGVVAEGEFHRDGSFVATNLLAKHDEKYMPPGLVKTEAGAMHETKTLR